MQLAQLNLNQIEGHIPGFKFSNNVANNSIGGIISALLPYVFAAAGLLLLFYLITGGLGLMTSKGEPKAAQAAKSNITNAFVGFIIIFISYWLVRLVGLIFNISTITDIFS